MAAAARAGVPHAKAELMSAQIKEESVWVNDAPMYPSEANLAFCPRHQFSRSPRSSVGQVTVTPSMSRLD